MTPEELLAFEARWPRHSTTKGEAIRGHLGISPARYYQLLHRAASSLEGIREHPITARRVRETLALRAASRERFVG
ncbi:DUF3263 domain-containing protein [Microbacterium sp. NPDC079176]|uniref:DUF3263 domain-containing protein n=1 Tax=Microbacterium sp. NPDC079176 TaxID=3154768 RepID=UPI0025CCD18D|nr:DUF3263 domain-containing protein [uncultured Microbacterium sp.]